ncbi:MAG: endolytic transglycosylase MltG [Fimbriimonas sp.]
MKRSRLKLLLGVLLVGGAAGGAYYWLDTNLTPMPVGPKRYLRWEKPARLDDIFIDLKRRGIIRNADAARVYAWVKRSPSSVSSGTYELAPGMNIGEILRKIRSPIRQMVRIPETNWARRNANVLEKKAVLRAEEYIDLVQKPELFKEYVSFPLPHDSLEGYLYPDTYDFPPLLGAKAVIIRQLQNFEKKVWLELDKPKTLHDAVIHGSLVELEAGTDEDRPMIAGVIENRLKKNMRLQIDASLLYGIQKWRTLTFDDYRDIKGPYNLYRVNGLPPGPICSPTVLSIKAAMNPAKHNHLYYVALPSGVSLFAPTYEEHKRNIQKRKKALKEQGT